jgi:hypothetical protein
MVIGFPTFRTAFDSAHPYPLPSGINFLHFGSDLYIDVLLLFEFPGGSGDQVLDVADNLADIIGYASSRIGRISAALVGGDFKLRIPATGL